MEDLPNVFISIEIAVEIAQTPVANQSYDAIGQDPFIC